MLQESRDCSSPSSGSQGEATPWRRKKGGPILSNVTAGRIAKKSRLSGESVGCAGSRAPLSELKSCSKHSLAQQAAACLSTNPSKPEGAHPGTGAATSLNIKAFEKLPALTPSAAAAVLGWSRKPVVSDRFNTAAASNQGLSKASSSNSLDLRLQQPQQPHLPSPKLQHTGLSPKAESNEHAGSRDFSKEQMSWAANQEHGNSAHSHGAAAQSFQKHQNHALQGLEEQHHTLLMNKSIQQQSGGSPHAAHEAANKEKVIQLIFLSEIVAKCFVHLVAHRLCMLLLSGSSLLQ